MFISELIKQDEMEKWNFGDNVLIEAQTGAGKSTWIFNELAHFCEQKNWKVLVLSNRSLLKMQNEGYVFTKNVRCENYQFLETMELFCGEKCLSDYQVICFDECHYLFRDATFNPNTQRTIAYLASKKNQSIRIFLSATPGPIDRIGLDFKFRYKLPENFSFIDNVYLFNDEETILEGLINTKKRQRTIYFVSDALIRNKISS